MVSKIIRDHGFEWFVLPLGFAFTIHFMIWTIVSFVAWDVFWISPFAHRLLFASLCIFVWVALISDACKDDKKEPSTDA